MEKINKMIVPAILIVSSILFIAIYYHEYFYDYCDCNIINIISSPNESWVVTVFSIDCGATVSFNTQASLSPMDAPFLRERYPPFLILNGDYKLNITWTDNFNLEITLPEETKIIRKEKINGIFSINYKQYR